MKSVPRLQCLTPRTRGSRAAWIGVLVVVLATWVNLSFFAKGPLFPGILGMGDAFTFFGSHAFMMDSAVDQGDFPLWNPFTFCGAPFAANPQVDLFYPPNLIRSLLTSNPTPAKTHVGLACLMVLHVLVAALGMFFFARANGLSVGGSLVAVFAFVFSASFMRRICANQFIEVVCWMPLQLLLMKRAFQNPAARVRRRNALLAGLVFGTSILGGFPQMTVYTLAAAAAFAALSRVVLPVGADETRRFGKRARDDVFVVVVAVGSLIAAAMLLPAAELAARSSRLVGSSLSVSELAQVDHPGEIAESLLVFPGPSNGSSPNSA